MGFALLESSSSIYTDAARNHDLMGINAETGPRKQANVQVIMTDYPDAIFADATLYAWNRGSKNDVDVFIGIDHITHDYKWVKVLYGLPGKNQSEADARTGDNELLAVTLRDRLLDEVKNDNAWPHAVEIIKTEVLDKFNRKPNKDFANLEPGIHPTNGQYTALGFISFFLSMVVTLFFRAKDPFKMD
jgi:hypothetical protein